MRAIGRTLPAVALVLLAAGCSGSPAPTAKPVPAIRLVAYSGCADALNGLRKATEQSVTAYGLGGDMRLERGIPGAVPDGGAAERGEPAAGGAPPAYSGTNVHEAAADEPDMVKTDGRRIVVLRQGRLLVLDPATRTVRHTLDLPDEFGGASDLLLSGDRALVISRSPVRRFVEDTPGRPYPGGGTGLLLVDLAGTPRIAGSMDSDSTYLDARMTGSVARVVVQSSPRLEFPSPPDPGGTREMLEANRRIVRSAPLSAWLPSFTVAGRRYSVPCERISRPAGSPGAEMLTVLTVDLAKPLGDPGAVSVATSGGTVYGNGTSLYVAGSPAPKATDRPDRPWTPRVEIHKFDVRGGALPRYLASGSVPGSLLNQYSMSEHAGDLRVAVTTARKPGTGEPSGRTLTPDLARTESAVEVLRQDGDRLAVIGRIGGLGKDEQIHAVRFLGAVGYVVTFRQTDPLYAIDLRDPARPRLAGELKIPGYSAYLHPLPDGRLLGVGQDADAQGRVQGTQVSLFDVTGTPRRISDYQVPQSGSMAEFDPHAFLYWPQSGLTVLPLMFHQTGGGEALVLSVGRDGLRRLGSVVHPDNEQVPSPIQRSLVVGGTLWTISQSGARATDAATLTSQAWLPFT